MAYAKGATTHVDSTDVLQPIVSEQEIKDTFVTQVTFRRKPRTGCSVCFDTPKSVLHEEEFRGNAPGLLTVWSDEKCGFYVTFLSLFSEQSLTLANDRGLDWDDARGVAI